MQSKFKIKVRTLKDEAIVCFPLENYHDQYLFAGEIVMMLREAYIAGAMNERHRINNR